MAKAYQHIILFILLLLSFVSPAQYLGDINDGFSSANYCSGDLTGTTSGLTLNPVGGPTSVCQYETETYTISEATGVATWFYWTVPAGASIITGQGTNTIVVTFDNTSGDIRALAINDCDTISEVTTITLTACNLYLGNINDGFSSANYCVGDLDGVLTGLTLNPVGGPTSVCQYETETYTISEATGVATWFYWTIPSDASIVTGQGTNTIVVTFGNTSGDIRALAINDCDTISEVTTITLTACNLYLGDINDGFSPESYCVGDLDGVLTGLTLNPVGGPTSVCQYETETYTISEATGVATWFYWTIPTGASIITGQGTNTIVVTFDNTSGDIRALAINDCDTISEVTTITLSACNLYLGNINDGFSSANYCSTELTGTPAASLTIDDISGPTQVDEVGTETYTTSVLTGYATWFYWTVPANATIVTGQGTSSINVTFGTNGGNVTVEAMNECESDNKLLAVTYTPSSIYYGGINDGFAVTLGAEAICAMVLDGSSSAALTINPIGGPSSACEFETETYTVSVATGYADNFYWTVPPGASIIKGQGTNMLVVTFGTVDGNIAVEAINTCETVSQSLAVTLEPCQNYYGSINDGFAIDAYCNGDLEGAEIPLAMDTILGDTAFCEYATKTYTAVVLTGIADNFYWKVPTGATVVSGQGTSTAIVTFTTNGGNVTVEAMNSCESAYDTLGVTFRVCEFYKGGINDGFSMAPWCYSTLEGAATGLNMSAISGPTSFCPGETETYTVSVTQGYAENFFWKTIPTGATIVSGQGFNKMNVTFGSASGNVEVDGINPCQTVSRTMAVTVATCSFYLGGINDGFAMDEFTDELTGAGLPIELLFFDAVLQKNKVLLHWKTMTEINNDYFTVERNKEVAAAGSSWEQIGTVDGAGNSTVLREYQTTDYYPYEGLSYYHLKQTDFDGNFSYSDAIAIVYEPNRFAVKIYPNLTRNEFYIEGSFETVSHLEIFDTKGAVILTKKINSSNFQKIAFNLPQGLYLYKITSDDGNFVIGKIIIE